MYAVKYYSWYHRCNKTPPSLYNLSHQCLNSKIVADLIINLATLHDVGIASIPRSLDSFQKLARPLSNKIFVKLLNTKKHNATSIFSSLFMNRLDKFLTLKSLNCIVK